MTTHHLALPPFLDLLGSLATQLTAATTWCTVHSTLLAVLVIALASIAVTVHEVLVRRALTERCRFVLTPSRRFEPSSEDIWRQTALLLRAARKGPWWAPRQARRVRVRLRADGSVPLEYSIEAPKSAAVLLGDSRFQEVTVAEADPAKDPFAEQCAQDKHDNKDKELRRKRRAEEKAYRAAVKQAKKDGTKPPKRDDDRLHAVRAEYVLRGRPSAALREVPLDPDPLQPLIDAVADLQADLGESAEVLLDIQSIPAWQLKLGRWKQMQDAHEAQRKAALRSARQAEAVAADVEDSLRGQLLRLLGPETKESPLRMVTPRPRAIDPAQALGRLHKNTGLVRIQLLVRCVSQYEGRARQLMEKVGAAMDVYGEDSRLAPDGGCFLKWCWGADSWHRRNSFDRRWTTGQVSPRRQNWLHVSELAGMLKPVTAHAVLPVLATELPDYVLGEPLVPHGILERPDGSTRVIATKEEEFLFSVAVGKTTYGKTEMAMVRALALAAGGAGVMFLDPHGDSWNKVAPYLAHPTLSGRVQRIDLARAAHQGALLPCWNLLGMTPGRNGNRVVSAAVDAMGTALAWTDSSTPRAITILTKACEALVAHNEHAVTAGRPDAQATLLQVRTLLSDKQWRDALLQHLSTDQRRWWETTFAGYQVAEALGPVLNPLDRLAANDITRAFLGSPVGSYDIRSAMDEGRIVWLCLEGTGPSDKLLVSLVMQDLLRAGLSRRELDEGKRRPFHVFADELISLDSAGGPTIAAINEQLRKFGGRLHVMLQLLNRLSGATRESLMQNSSAVSTTAGSMAAVRAVAEEWQGAVSPAAIAELPRFSHYVQVTADGRRVGPLKVKGLQVSELFKDYRSPKLVPGMIKDADRRAGAESLRVLLERAARQDGVVLEFTSGSASTDAAAPQPADAVEVAERGVDKTRGVQLPKERRAPEAQDAGAQAPAAVKQLAKSQPGRPARKR